MSKDTKKYHLLKDMINWSTGHVIPKGEEFIQLQGTRKYQSLNGWQMSESACLNKEWFKEVLPEQPKQQEERIEINGNRVHYELGENGVPNIISIKGYLFYPATNAQKTFTQSEVDTIREETWEESRKLTSGLVIGGYMGTGLKYPTLQDYLQSLSENKYFERQSKPMTESDVICPRQSYTNKNQEQGSKEGWEILSVLDDDGKPIYYPSDDIRQMVSKNKGERIHSVRRNSDMTVFTVGDIMSYGTAGVGTPLFSTENQLLSFNIREDGMIYGEVGDKIFFPITHLHKAKSPSQPQQGNPLFTTDDGKEIRDGEIFYWLVEHPDCWNLFEEKASNKTVIASNMKTFHSKETGEQYILNNRPCLSLNDLLDVWGNADIEPKERTRYKGSPLFQEFEQYAKKKLNQ